MQAACRGGCRKAESPCLKDNGQRCFSMNLKVFRAGASVQCSCTSLKLLLQMHVLNVHARLGQGIFEEKKHGAGAGPFVDWGLAPPQGSSAGGTLPLLYSIKTHLAHQLPLPPHIPPV
jgi:hypothetical protein